MQVRRRSGTIVEAVRRLSDADVDVEDLALRRPTLDDVFLTLTGHAAEEEPQPGRKVRGRARARNRGEAN
jgi:ABC-2 type transport system ATP-binding protein